MAKDQLELPKGWSMERCAKCGMIFALPPLKGDSSRVLAMRRIKRELKRHIEQIGNYYHGFAQGPQNR